MLFNKLTVLSCINSIASVIITKQDTWAVEQIDNNIQEINWAARLYL